MDCGQAREEFAALLDGELVPEERAAVESHLSECSDCLRELDGLKRVDVLYRQLPPVAAPAGFDERVRGVLRPGVLRLRLRPAKRPWWPTLVAAAALLVVAGTIVVATQFASRTAFDMAAVQSAKESAPQAETAMRAAPADNSTVMPGTVEKLDTAASDSPTMAYKAMRDRGDLGDEVSGPSEVEAAPAAPAPASSSGTEPRVAGVDGARKGPAPARVRARGFEGVLDESAASNRQAVALAEKPAPRRLEEAAKDVTEQKVKREADRRDKSVAQTQAFALPKELSMEKAEATAAPASPPAMTTTPVSLGATVSEEQRQLAQAPAAAAPSPMSSPGAAAEGFSLEPKAGVAGRTLAADGLSKVAAETKKAGGREFELDGRIWRQKGYASQGTTRLERESEALKKLVAAHSDLKDVLGLGERVVFKVGDTWYEVRPKSDPKP